MILSKCYYYIFTGSAELNKTMRKNAKKLGYKLSEYGLFNIKDNKKLDVKSEYDIFKFLKLEYLEPTARNID
jgi:DNA polymerase (family 10)